MAKVDVFFRVLPTEIPADHGFWLFSAISRLIPGFHADEDIGVHPLFGHLVGNRRLALTERSRLGIRLAAERIHETLPLAGTCLELNGDRVQVGVPEVRPLTPAPRVHSRLVVIKGFLEPDDFLDAVKRQLGELSISGKALLTPRPVDPASGAGPRSPYLRRTLRIRDKEIVGYAVEVEELTAEESIRLQEAGLGGRRRFGCGVFVPGKRGDA